ncbi:helix-turn-helix domain-containing protein [uncultured Flavonifractor sp.]|uniref:helix-turn-helix domain-containing protein n=1 Tax=uncultured Flavonifractor sp. TaxID=1193534 RepID=UPI0026087EAA|nr:helix-turn-helix transcriptional regulator [uncultured Flavonifractor sp.]
MFQRTVFSTRLKELIQKQNMTYAQLGKILGVSTAQVSDMANGKTATTMERLYILCETFQVSADYLLGLTDELRPISDVERT